MMSAAFATDRWDVEPRWDADTARALMAWRLALIKRRWRQPSRVTTRRIATTPYETAAMVPQAIADAVRCALCEELYPRGDTTELSLGRSATARLCVTCLRKV